MNINNKKNGIFHTYSKQLYRKIQYHILNISPNMFFYKILFFCMVLLANQTFYYTLTHSIFCINLFYLNRNHQYFKDYLNMQFNSIIFFRTINYHSCKYNLINNHNKHIYQLHWILNNILDVCMCYLFN
jgi:hypothetical protein